VRPATPQQLPLDLGHVPGYSRDDLIVGSANRAAVDLVGCWPDWPSPVAILCGPAGSGKTHLAAIWSAEAGATVVDPAEIGRAAIAQGEAGPIVIDDIGGRQIDEAGLFHVINAVRSAGTQILMTSRLRPASWPVRLPDLASRLNAATVVEIAVPDDALLAAVITKLFADRQVSVEPHVVSFLIGRIERSLSAASRIVDLLDRAALERKGRITRALAAEVAAAMMDELG
jgi:chromosomal replication initiation ATPase DnaA